MQKDIDKPVYVHSYCLTARIILDQRIYCEKCHFQYNLFIKQEQICSGNLLILVAKYFLFMFILVSFSVMFLVSDGILKTMHHVKSTDIEQTEDEKKA